MQKYTRDTITQVLSAVDIVDVIGARVSLKPAGTDRFKGLSPFTNEKTPSFTVSRDRQRYHCFSSGKGGDSIEFLMAFEGLSFNEALRKLADMSGIRLNAPSEQDDRDEYLRGQLLELGKFASETYRRLLLDPVAGAPGRDYLQRRKLNEQTLARFGIGYAPDQWSTLCDAALRKQFKEFVLEASGLFRRGDRGDRSLYDFFRNRLIFPIRDVSGNVVAFGGRDLSGQSPAKYINSPETAVYKKSRVLYGLNEARDALRREKYAILVEGYIDLMRCFDAGIENVVATCGTALTEQQASLIRRYVPEVVVVYDGDAAGIKAALRGTGILIAAGLRVRAMTLPDGKDPDDYIRDDGAEAFKALLAQAPDFLHFYVAMSQERTRTVEGRTELAHELFQILRGIADTLRTDEYVREIARALGLQDWACRREYEQFCRDADTRETARAALAPAKPVDTGPSQPIKDDIDFIAALVNYPELRRGVGAELADLTLPDGPVSEVLAWLLAQPVTTELAFVGQDLQSEAARGLLSAAAVCDPPEESRARTMVHLGAQALVRMALQQETAQMQEEILRAERDKDHVRLLELLRHRTELSRRLDIIAAR